MDHAIEIGKRTGDYISVGSVVAVFFEVLPPASDLGKGAALLALIWWIVRIYYEVRNGERSLRRK
jgi:hypothetical protein